MSGVALTSESVQRPVERDGCVLIAWLAPWCGHGRMCAPVYEKATEKHLQLLSELAQMFSDKALREAMSGAADAAQLHALIAAWLPDAAGQRRAAA